MRIYKKVDVAIQIIILLASVIVTGFDFTTGLFCYFLGYLAWDLLSIMIHAVIFKVPEEKIRYRRQIILLHASFIVAVPLIMIYVIPGFEYMQPVLYAYMAYTFIMPLYYLWMNFQEIYFLDEIHDQVNLLDVGQH